MAITANVDLGNGASASSCYIIIPEAYVKKFPKIEVGSKFKLIYDVRIFKDATDRENAGERKQIPCREVDHFKIDYDLDATDNPFKLAYAHLKTNSKLSSVADA